MQVDPVRRMFDILRKENCRYICPEDLKSMMAGILLSHPGLEFLQETPEFQDRYSLDHQVKNVSSCGIAQNNVEVAIRLMQFPNVAVRPCD